jgi:hypothetical protein
MITQKRMLVACAVVVLGLGLFSCVLEPTVDSPNSKPAERPEGTEGLSVSQPSITFDGATTILTYKVTADFSNWETEGSPQYTAQGSTKSQSIDALISHYLGKTLLVGASPVSNGQIYTLKKRDANNDLLPPYVIIPLDTSLIRDWLKKRLQPPVDVSGNDEDIDIPLVWIEKNLTIGKVEQAAVGIPPTPPAWEDGVYEDTSIRIGGIYKLNPPPPPPTPPIVEASTVENFADGKDGRILSIATVLADEKDQEGKRYISTINFYANNEAREIERELPGTSSSSSGTGTATLNDAKALETWMKGNKPVLRVVYEWAD